jgi:hypothetical protein
MPAQSRQTAPRGGSPSRLRAILAILAVPCLAGLLVYLLVSGGDSKTSRSAALCAPPTPPAVGRVPPRELGPLRAAVARVVPQRVARLYEEGTVSSRSAWSDAEPDGPPVSPSAPRSAGYEMRWWAPNGDDIAADVFLFAHAREARRFLALAASPRCRRSARVEPTLQPPLSRGLRWLNPDEAAEADLYLLRGRRVYRVVDVPSGQRGRTLTTGRLRRALLTVETLACLLPDARCAIGGGQGVPA